MKFWNFLAAVLGFLLISTPAKAQQDVRLDCLTGGAWLPCPTGNQIGSGSAGYPPGSIPQVAVFSGADTTTQQATLTPSGAQFAYLCTAEVNGLGATAATAVTPQITGLQGGTLNFTGQYNFATGAAVVDTPFTRSYLGNCLRGSALGQAISLVVPGAAGNTSTIIQISGYVQ